MLHGKRSRRALGWITLVCASSCALGHASDEWFESWSMERRISNAQLVLVARVVGVSELTLVEGAKIDTTLREYQFQPVSTLKGVFGRDQLSMTGSDLGFMAEDGATTPPIQQGEHRLLLLTRRSGGFGCGGSSRIPLAQRIPLLDGPADPVAQMAETFVEELALLSRRRRVDLLVEKLRRASGASVVPILASLRERGPWTARNSALLEPLLGLTRAPSHAIRTAALETAVYVIRSDYLKRDKKKLRSLAVALRQMLDDDFGAIALRSRAIETLGELGQLSSELAWIRETLLRHLRSPRAYAERSAAASALRSFNDKETAAPLLEALGDLPLDEKSAVESAFFAAVADLDRAALVPLLIDRVSQSLDGDLSVSDEVVQLGRMEADEAVDVLLRIMREANLNRSEAGKSLNRVLEVLGKFKGGRLVTALSGWLRHPDRQTRTAARRSLMAIGGPDVVALMKARLKVEPGLDTQLRMAKFLGENGVDSGHFLGLEHLADTGYTARAAEVLAACKSPGTREALLETFRSSRDPRWTVAALVGLAEIGAPEAREPLLNILTTGNHPHLELAIYAASRMDDPAVLAPLAEQIRSRNHRVALAALHAAEVIASRRPPAAGDTPPAWQQIGDACLSMARDSYAEADLRVAALKSLEIVDDIRFLHILKELADRSDLEGTNILGHVERKLAELKVEL